MVRKDSYGNAFMENLDAKVIITMNDDPHDDITHYLIEWILLPKQALQQSKRRKY